MSSSWCRNPGQDAAGARRLCQSQSGQARLGLRARQHAAHSRRVAEAGDRHRHRLDSLSRRRSGARRPARRPRAHEHRAARRHAAAHSGGQGAPAGLHRARPAASICRTCRPRRKRAFRRSATTLMSGSEFSGRPARRPCGRQDQCRGQRRTEDAGSAGGVPAIGLRGEIRHATRVRGPSGRRVGEMAGAARGRGHQGAVATPTRQPR